MAFAHCTECYAMSVVVNVSSNYIQFCRLLRWSSTWMGCYSDSKPSGVCLHFIWALNVFKRWVYICKSVSHPTAGTPVVLWQRMLLVLNRGRLFVHYFCSARGSDDVNTLPPPPSFLLHLPTYGNKEIYSQ